jgi:hypothetical protein
LTEDPVKIIGVSMVRNEADIIEVFVRHNLAFLDGLVVIDHGSADATLGILQSLAKERLPLRLLANEDSRFLQAEAVTDVTRRLIEHGDADVVLPMDADEFVKTPSRDVLERALKAIPANAYGQLHWQNYVPDFAHPDPDPRRAIASARRATSELHGLYKVAVTRTFASKPRAILTQGLHRVAPHVGATVDRFDPHARLRPESVAIAHLPLRSAEQYIVKVAVKKLGRIASGIHWTPDAAMQVAYTRICEGRPIDPDVLRIAAANWSLPVGRWVDPATREWIDDPFLADIPLRYTPSRESASMPIVLDAIDRLARRLRDGARATRADPA